MFLNKKRLLLTLYRLEEGQQDILQRLDRLERRGDTSPDLPSPGHLPLEGKTSEGEGNITPDTWIIDGIEAILSYRRGKEGEQ